MSAAIQLLARLLQAIELYLKLGWHLFPVKPDKTPKTKRGFRDATNDIKTVMAWWKRTPPAMIGVRMGPLSGVFAIDIDVDESKKIDGMSWLAAVEARHGPLPKTPRAKTPRGGVHIYFKYPADRALHNSTSRVAPGVDVRGDGGYVVAPPSEGEAGAYEWLISPNDCEVASAPEWLLDLVCDTPLPPPVSGALMVTDEPLSEADQNAVVKEIDTRIETVVNAKEGTRNHTLNVAAFICGKLVGAAAAVESDVASKLLEAAEKAGLTRQEAERTIRSGLRAGKRRPWRPAAASPMLAEINRDYFFALDGRASFVFREDVDPRTGNRYLAHITPNAFRDLFGNQLVEFPNKAGDIKLTPAGHAWLKWRGRRQYQKVVFAPGKTLPATIYNQWQGFAAEPIEGDCSKFLAFVREVICSDDTETFDYLIRWCARAVQDPSSPGQVAIVMRGAKGTGKTFFGAHFGELFGDHFVTMAHSQHLVGNFNAHLETAIVVLADEAFWAGDKQGEGALKTLITSDTIRIERKGIDSKNAPNHVHLIMASNSDWVVPASTDERRYCVLDVSNKRAQDHRYFEELEAEWQVGGREAFMHYLLHLDLTSFNVRRAPQSQALLEQKLWSMAPTDRWYLAMLREGRNSRDGRSPNSKAAEGGADSEWAEWVSSDELFQQYKDFAQSENVRYQLAEVAFGMKLARLLPPPEGDATTRRVQRQEDRRRAWGYVFPDLKECRAHFERTIGCSMSWDADGPIPAAPPKRTDGLF